MARVLRIISNSKIFIMSIIVFFIYGVSFAEEIKLTTIMPAGVADDVLKVRKGAVGLTYKESAQIDSIINNNLAIEGSLGIGTLAPFQPLHIVRNVNAIVQAIVQNKNTGSGSQGNFVVMDSTNDGVSFGAMTGAGTGNAYIWNNFENGSIWLATKAAGAPTTAHLAVTPSGNVGIGTTSPAVKLDVNGQISAKLDYAGYVMDDVVVDPANGTFYRTMGAYSSVRYKTDIRNLYDDFLKILTIEPKSFTYKNSGIKGIGYIAEDLDALGLKNLIVYDKEGRPDSINYDKISLYAVEILKDHEKKIEGLKAENEALKARVDALERRFNAGR